MVPGGGASVTRGSGMKTGVSEPYGLQPEMTLEASKRVPSQECRTPAAVSEDTGAPDMLTGLPRRASFSEEHRTLMATVVKRVLSAKIVLNKAFTSLLRGFEVCDVALSIEFY